MGTPLNKRQFFHATDLDLSSMTINPQQFGDEDPHYRFQDPLAKTEEERLEKKRFEAGFAFELNHPPAKRSTLKRPEY